MSLMFSRSTVILYMYCLHKGRKRTKKDPEENRTKSEKNMMKSEQVHVNIPVLHGKM